MHPNIYLLIASFMSGRVQFNASTNGILYDEVLFSHFASSVLSKAMVLEFAFVLQCHFILF